MKYLGCLLLLLLASPSNAQQRSGLPLIPEPASVQTGKGAIRLNHRVMINSSAESRPAATFLASYLNRTWKIDAVVTSAAKQISNNVQTITLHTDNTSKLPAEGYKLVVTNKNISINGNSAGLFYGIQTLIQLFGNADTPVLPCITIEDAPRYAYRGLMLDVSRHFFTVSQIKDLLDLMAYYKLNRFHWHLTDDQGWRLEIKSYPKLTSVGAWRVPRPGDFGANLLPPQPGEKATDGGFYTQEQVKDIVQYAAERHIEVMPEIDVPGHSMAAVAAYPELSVTKNPDTQVNPGNTFSRWFTGGFEMYLDNTLNPTDENVYRFLDKVFGEVAALFPYPYIHIGGDECFKGYWEKDAGVKAFMQQHDIKDTHQLQSYFIARVNKIVSSKGKKLIGWDEILDGGLSDSVAVTGRFGEKRAIEQIRSGHNVVLAPGGNGLYFDYAQSTSDMEPDSHGGNAPLWKAYNFNPDFPSLTTENKKHIMGVEGCVWTEHIPSVPKLQFMILPRMLALAETGWSKTEKKSYPQFADEVLPAHLLRFDKAGINYRVPAAFNYTDTTLMSNNFTLDVKPTVPGAKVYYSVSDRQPGDSDHEYVGRITFNIPENKKLIIKTVVITPAGHRSIVTRTIIDNTLKK